MGNDDGYYIYPNKPYEACNMSSLEEDKQVPEIELRPIKLSHEEIEFLLRFYFLIKNNKSIRVEIKSEHKEVVKSIEEKVRIFDGEK